MLVVVLEIYCLLLAESLNDGMELIQDRSLHTEALEIYKLWERTQVA